MQDLHNDLVRFLHVLGHYYVETEREAFPSSGQTKALTRDLYC